MQCISINILSLLTEIIRPNLLTPGAHNDRIFPYTLNSRSVSNGFLYALEAFFVNLELP